MKVYVLHDYYYDHEEYAGSTTLMGIYSTREAAENARQKCIAEAVYEATTFGAQSRIVKDCLDSLSVERYNKDVVELSNTFAISEHEVK